MIIENGKRVRVSDKYGSYSGKYFGRAGIVEKYVSQGKSVGVRLEGLTNKSSSYGLFWFKWSELEIIPGKGESAGVGNIRIVKAKHIGQIGNKVYSWRVPDKIKNINVGDTLMVDTAKGYKGAVACSEILSCDSEEKPTKSVIRVKHKFASQGTPEQEFDVRWLKNKKENKNMKTLGILDLWKKNKDDKDKEMYQREFDKVLFDDVHFKFLKDKTNEINTYLIENGFTKSNEIPRLIYTSEETKAEIENLKKVREGNLADITVQYNEIKTMLSACDTYEQEIDVLKAYKIVDENGVLIKE